jgi:hypothetical protein
MTGFTLLLTITFVLGLGIILGYGLVSGILRAFGRRSQPPAEAPALVTSQAHGGD